MEVDRRLERIAGAAGLAVPGFAEPQDVTAGGLLRIRGNWFNERGLSFDEDNNSDALGCRAGYAHFFADDGVENGRLVAANGTAAIGGLGEADDLDYGFIESRLRF